MRLVEIVKGDETSGQTLNFAFEFVKSLGKKAIVSKDFPGFMTSRLGLAQAVEAMRMLEDGLGTPEDIDCAMELGYNHPMGPFRLSDWVGLDVRLKILEEMHRSLGEHYRPPKILCDLVAQGKLGRKTGEGFYKYDKGQR
jgi:3-hydroxybutyryl-CoA dehydrogenase